MFNIDVEQSDHLSEHPNNDPHIVTKVKHISFYVRFFIN